MISLPFCFITEMAGQNPTDCGWNRQLIQLFPSETGNNEQYNGQEKAIFVDKSGIDVQVDKASWPSIFAFG